MNKNQNQVINIKITLPILIVLSFFCNFSYGQIYKSVEKKGIITFHSSTPIEDIDAKSEAAVSILNTAYDSVMVRVSNESFIFPNKLMQEHFNENYMESTKYTHSVFRGKMSEKIDLTKDGEYKLKAVGNLDIHGVKKPRTLEGIIKVNNGEVHLISDFKVKLVDHNIEVPKVVMNKIAEEIEVKCNYTYLPFKKK